MKLKFFISSFIISTLLPIHAHAANRCLEMIDKRVNRDALNLSECRIKTEEMPLVLAYLDNHKNITTLDFSFNDVDSSAIASLAKNTTLSTLNVMADNIDVEGAKALAKNTTLKTLYLGVGNEITDEGATALANNQTLEILDISLN